MSFVRVPTRLSFLSLLVVLSASTLRVNSQSCRNAPGDAGFPTDDAWSALNASISGRLTAAVPSGQFCRDRGGCTDAEWSSATFRAGIPGAMDYYYGVNPPEVCVHNSTTCGQGNVPLYAILATTAEDVQAGIAFAEAYNLRVAIKASGHDASGRSTARDSLLISTHLFQNISFHDDFQVGNNSMGTAVTVGSGVFLNNLYRAAKDQGKILVGGGAATVVAAGGYIQGGGHSPLSPLLGLAADNVLQFTIVTADSEVVTADETQNSDLFWALRGGGAGSWGVILSATFRTYPTFNGTHAITLINTSGSNATSTMADIMRLHAEHIFDMDDLRIGQYFFVFPNATSGFELTLTLNTYFPNVTEAVATAAIQPFLDDAVASGGRITSQSVEEMNINDILAGEDDAVGANLVMGSRLFPEDVYRNSPAVIGEMYTKLFERGDLADSPLFVGQVAANTHIDSAVTPKWRTSKTHMMVVNAWADDAEPSEVQAQTELFQKTQLPIFEEVIGTDGGAYSNEADLTELNFQTTFYGPNYDRLSEIKRKYDPSDRFIVEGGVGSERWDRDGFCMVV
ncbi:FAD-binding domain-containing protein [Hymenopellis radicata]|nr:FAD-binding domain-containing protein [Hymenopellis radicata]